MRKFTFCRINDCGIPIIGHRTKWVTPVCVGHLPPPKPLDIAGRLIQALKEKGL